MSSWGVLPSILCVYVDGEGVQYLARKESRRLLLTRNLQDALWIGNPVRAWGLADEVTAKHGHRTEVRHFSAMVGNVYKPWWGELEPTTTEES